MSEDDENTAANFPPTPPLEPPSTLSGPSEVVHERNVNELLSNFSNLLTNPADRKHFIKAISGHTSRATTRHKGPYYKAKYALQFKMVLDEILKDGKSRIYRYKDYPGYSARTLYLRLLQSRDYLKDCLDAEGKYKLACEAIDFDKKYGVGIVVHLRHDILSGIDDFKRPTILSDDAVNWKEQLQRFLDDNKADNNVFELKDIVITPEEKDQLEMQLGQLSNIIYRIAFDKITVIKES